MSDLFEQAGIRVDGDRWRFHLHGRYLSYELRGWRNQTPHRIVIHYDETVVADNEQEAIRKLEALTGKPDGRHHQWQHLWRGTRIQQK